MVVVTLIYRYAVVLLLLDRHSGSLSSLSLGMLLRMAEALVRLLLTVWAPRGLLGMPVMLLVREQMRSLNHVDGGYLYL